MVIGRCVESLTVQTYPKRNYEIIVVDDGSKDNTVEACKSLCDAGINMRILSKSNGGPSSARNFGLDFATGDYIVFVDADDWVDSNYLELLDAELENCDILVHGCTYEYSEKSLIKKLLAEPFFAPGQMTLNEAVTLLDKEYFFSAPWLCVYKKSIIDTNKLRYNERIRYGEDVCFSLSYLKHISSIRYESVVGYHYDNRLTSSITHNYIPNRYPLCHEKFRLRKEVYSLYGGFNDAQKELYSKSLTAEINGCILNVALLENKKTFRKKLDEIKTICQDQEIRYWYNEYPCNMGVGERFLSSLVSIIIKNPNTLFVSMLLVTLSVKERIFK